MHRVTFSGWEKRHLDRSSGTTAELRVDNRRIVNPTEIRDRATQNYYEIFNKWPGNPTVKRRTEDLENLMAQEFVCDPEAAESTVSVANVVRAFAVLKPRKTTGRDGQATEVLQASGPQIAWHHTAAFNCRVLNITDDASVKDNICDCMDARLLGKVPKPMEFKSRRCASSVSKSTTPELGHPKRMFARLTLV